MRSRRYFRLLVILFLVAVIPGAMYIYSVFRKPVPQEYASEKAGHHPPQNRLRIGGLRFEGHIEGRRTISIKADSFTIEKMKLGFFRFGLMNEARLKNAVIDIYGERKGLKTQSDLNSSGEKPNEVQSHPKSAITFADTFRKESLPSFGSKNIHAITMDSVHVNLHDETSVITKITAASASIRMKNREILFKGGVQVVSGPRSLKTDQLCLLPENGILKTTRPFVLITPEKRQTGGRLTTDVFLNVHPVAVQ